MLKKISDMPNPPMVTMPGVRINARKRTHCGCYVATMTTFQTVDGALRPVLVDVTLEGGPSLS